jgi:hypothetical protein
MDNADTGLGRSAQSICCHLRGRKSPPMIYRLHKICYKLYEGFFVLELTGDTVRLIPPPDGFVPKKWETKSK